MKERRNRAERKLRRESSRMREIAGEGGKARQTDRHREKDADILPEIIEAVEEGSIILSVT